MQNPYTLLFGREPLQYISRIAQINEILEEFKSETPSQQIYMITGVRGSGKTVMMTSISKELAADKNWIIIELNPESDLLQDLGAKLYEDSHVKKLFKSLNISLSLFGIGVDIKQTPQIVNVESAISKLLAAISKQGKRVLITIDEVTNSENIRKFASAFQIFIRQDAQLFLLMTGLYENISELQDVDNLTFLYRAPKCQLAPLNLTAIICNYSKVLGVDEKSANRMAHLTCGYSFAFQVLGYLTFKHKGNYEEAIPEYRQYLEEYVYEKIWSELSNKDKEILLAVANSREGKVSEIKALANIESNKFSPYRVRLIRKGILNGDNYGYLTFNLPFFAEFTKVMCCDY